MPNLTLTRLRELRREIRAFAGPEQVAGIVAHEAWSLIDMAEREAERIDDLAKRRSTYRLCTGPLATDKRCPVHGECLCESWEGAVDLLHEWSPSPECPLHSHDSLHAVPPIEGMVDETGSGK